MDRTTGRDSRATNTPQSDFSLDALSRSSSLCHLKNMITSHFPEFANRNNAKTREYKGDYGSTCRELKVILERWPCGGHDLSRSLPKIYWFVKSVKSKSSQLRFVIPAYDTVLKTWICTDCFQWIEPYDKTFYVSPVIKVQIAFSAAVMMMIYGTAAAEYVKPAKSPLDVRLPCYSSQNKS